MSQQRVPRSLAWRVSLGLLGRHDTRAWPQALAEHRTGYKELKRQVLQAPDGSYPPGLGVEETKKEAAGPAPPSAAVPSPVRSGVSVDVNNPLSLADDNPWHAHFDKLAMLEQIQKDVQRTFPEEEDRIRAGSPGGKARFNVQLSAILAVWSLLDVNRAIGYRQGMNELAAVCWIVVMEDAMDGMVGSSTSIASLVQEQDVEADAFTLFAAIMDRASAWYAWKSSSKLPIHEHCETVQSSLMFNDDELGRHLERLGISLQLFVIRWLRLLFVRELPLAVALALWDGLFDIDPSLYLVDHICVAMLVRLRTELLASDNSSALRLLLSYPAKLVETGESARLLLDEARQAHRRYASMLNGKETPELMPGTLSNASAAGRQMAGPVAAHGYATPLLADLARGVYTQSLGAGLHRAINNVQRTVNAAYQSHTQSHSNDGFPPSVDAPGGRANVLARTEGGPASAPLPDARLQVNALLAKNRQMGVTLGDVVEVLERFWTDTMSDKQVDATKELEGKGKGTDDEAEKKGHVDFLVSLTALKHMRDVLVGHVTDFDPVAVLVDHGDTAVAAPLSDPASSTRESPLTAGSRQSPSSSSSSPTVRATLTYPPPRGSDKDRSFGTRFQRTTDGDVLQQAVAGNADPAAKVFPTRPNANPPSSITTVVHSDTSPAAQGQPTYSTTVAHRSSATKPPSTSLDDPLGAGGL